MKDLSGCSFKRCFAPTFLWKAKKEPKVLKKRQFSLKWKNKDLDVVFFLFLHCHSAPGIEKEGGFYSVFDMTPMQTSSGSNG